LSSLTALIPGVGLAVAASLQVQKAGLQIAASKGDKPLIRGQEKLGKQATKRQEIGERYLALKNQTEANSRFTQSQIAQLKDAELSILKNDPQKHKEYLAKLAEMSRANHSERIRVTEGIKIAEAKIAERKPKGPDRPNLPKQAFVSVGLPGQQPPPESASTKDGISSVVLPPHNHANTQPHLQFLSLSQLAEKDAALAKKHADDESVKNMWWDSARNIVVIEKSGKFRAYQIGAGKSPALSEHKKKSEVLNAIEKRPTLPGASAPSSQPASKSSSTSYVLTSHTSNPLSRLANPALAGIVPKGILDPVGGAAVGGSNDVKRQTAQEKEITNALDEDVKEEEDLADLENLNKELDNLIIENQVIKDASFAATIDLTMHYAEGARDQVAQGYVSGAVASAKKAQEAASEAQEHALKMQLQEILRIDRSIEIGEQNVQSQNSPEAAQALEESRKKKAELTEAFRKRYQSLCDLRPRSEKDPKGFDPLANPLEIYSAEVGSELSHLSDEALSGIVAGVVRESENAVNLAKDTKAAVTSAKIRNEQLAPLHALHKGIKTRRGLLDKIFTPSEKEAFNLFERNLEDNQKQIDNLVATFAHSVNHTLKLVDAWDAHFSKEGEEWAKKIPDRSPEAAIKFVEFLGCIDQIIFAVQDFRAFSDGQVKGSSVGDVFQNSASDDAEEKSQSSSTGAETAKRLAGMLDVVKTLATDERVKTVLSIVVPMSKGLVLLSDVILIAQGKSGPKDPQLEAIEKLHKGMEEKLEKLEISVEIGFALANAHMSLIGASIGLQIETTAEEGRHNRLCEGANSRFYGIRSTLRGSYKQGLYPDYKLYIKESEPFSHRTLLATLGISASGMVSYNTNGAWLSTERTFEGTSIEHIDQLSVARTNPVQTTGLLALHLLDQDRVPDLYQYEHYAHMFVQLAAKLLMENPMEDLESIKATSTALITHGNSLEVLFSRETIDKALTEYKEKQLTLIEALRGDLEAYKYQELLPNYARPGKKEVLQVKADTFSFLEGFKPGFYKASSLNRQGPTIQPDKVMGHSIERAYGYVYGNTREGNFYVELLKDFYYFGVNTIDKELLRERTYSLSSLSTEIKDKYKFFEKTLLSIWEDKQFQRISSKEREGLQGNFIELAYRVDVKARQLNFCTFETKEEMLYRWVNMKQDLSHNEFEQEFKADRVRSVADQLVRNQGLFDILGIQRRVMGEVRTRLRPHVGLDRSQLRSQAHQHAAFDIDNPSKSENHVELTRDLNKEDFDFNKTFSFSIILSAGHQTANDLTGRTFVVLSDKFNQEGLKKLQKQEFAVSSEKKEAEPLEEKKEEGLLPKKPKIELVEYDHRIYKKIKTSPYGACALHALLGEYTGGPDGQYKKENARQALVEKLTTEPMAQAIQKVNGFIGGSLPPRWLETRKTKLTEIKETLQSEINSILSLPSEHTGPMGPTPNRGTSFVKTGKTQPIEELAYLTKELAQDEESIGSLVQETRDTIKEKLTGLDREHPFNDFYSGRGVPILESELELIFQNAEQDIHQVLKDKKLKLCVPLDRAEKVLWDEKEERWFPKTFKAKLSEIVSKLVAIKWIDENLSFLEGFQNRQRDVRLVMPPKHRDLLDDILRSYLNDAPIGDVFYSDPWKALKETEKSLRAAEKTAWIDQWEKHSKIGADGLYEDDHEVVSFLGTVFELAPKAKNDPFKNMNAGQIREKIEENTDRILGVVAVDIPKFLSLLTEEEGRSISDLIDRRSRNLEEQNTFINNPGLFNHYIETIQKQDFWFNDREINLMAYLFDKKVQLIKVKDGIQTLGSPEPFNKELPGDTVVIHSDGATHYSRCESKDTSTYVEGLLEKPVVQVGAIEIDKREKLLREYQEFLNVKFVRGVEFVREIKNNDEIAINPFDSKQVKLKPGETPPPLKYTAFDKAILLSPKDENLCPLAFPPALLTYIETRVAPSGIKRANVEITRTYSFEQNEITNFYELTIDYKLKAHDYLKFVVAQFGEDVVDAFRTQLLLLAADTSFKSACLVQLMYGDGLPVPSDGSFRIISTGPNTVVPVPWSGEKPFTGVYNLLAKEIKKEGNITVVERVDHALPKSKSSDVKTLIEIGMATADKAIRTKPLGEYEKAEKVYRHKVKETTANLRKSNEYKEAQKAFLQLKTLLELTIDRNELDSITFLSPDSVVVTELESVLEEYKKDIACKISRQVLDHSLKKSLERGLVSKHLKNLKAIHDFANRLSGRGPSAEVVHPPAEILEICSNPEPFSDYQVGHLGGR